MCFLGDCEGDCAEFSCDALLCTNTRGSFGKSVRGNAKLPLRTATSEPRLSLTSSGEHCRQDRQRGTETNPGQSTVKTERLTAVHLRGTTAGVYERGKHAAW